ncbi:putative cas1 appressorium specific protein [Phaeoacremonium minimum UCRPA7]|uniref:Putative cas1 appressorium specific protein n=1 Tax=Phaeoacremonium minimum (strain UCR-PA7) TaxID=1286976 RepID=R8BAZ3_PHAM7|nr:putative cas1 appressorium specific protein [Phaeoacremonium minimum UCRPA7]EON96503.1 putative cas1 appressorium specific protein [Phaeoacremonium minimum UCRPA7]
MLFKALLFSLIVSPLVTAHGKVSVITGDAGGNTTALAIQGGIVPGPGKNSVTEVDTTVFRKTNILSDGLGRTTGQGANKVKMLAQAIALSGDTLPQVSDNGTISGVFHIVTTDGAGPVKAVLDPTGTGAFSQVAMGIVKRAANVNEDFPVEFSVPAGTTCSGTINGINNVCLVKIANSNKAGPFGGVVAIQMASQVGSNNDTAVSTKCGRAFIA